MTVGVLGSGTVGQDVLNLIQKRKHIFDDIGVNVEIAGVLVRDVQKKRNIPDGIRVTDTCDFLQECGVVIETMGGVDRPLEILHPYLRSHRSVITANKALLAERWDVLREYALDGNLYYEASVMAGTPVIGPMSTVLRASTFTRLQAVLNGTCNFILSKMEAEGRDFADVLAEARALGYAEADPTFDVEGIDAAHKLTILASIAFHTRVSSDDVHTEGIREISIDDIKAAKAADSTIKLLAICERLQREDGSEAVNARVHPTLVPKEHPLASVSESYNAIFVEAEAAGLPLPVSLLARLTEGQAATTGAYAKTWR